MLSPQLLENCCGTGIALHGRKAGCSLARIRFNPMTTRQLTRACSCREIAEIKSGVTPHTLRHSFCNSSASNKHRYPLDPSVTRNGDILPRTAVEARNHLPISSALWRDRRIRRRLERGGVDHRPCTSLTVRSLPAGADDACKRVPFEIGTVLRFPL